jgi:hypothetical protein
MPKLAEEDCVRGYKLAERRVSKGALAVRNVAKDGNTIYLSRNLY